MKYVSMLILSEIERGTELYQYCVLLIYIFQHVKDFLESRGSVDALFKFLDGQTCYEQGEKQIKPKSLSSCITERKSNVYPLSSCYYLESR